MDKKAKELLRKRKRAQQSSSSESSSSSDSDSASRSDSYSSSSTIERNRHRRQKKMRSRQSSSSSEDEKTKRREKHALYKKAEERKNHMRRKLKESRSKKRAMSPATLSKRHHHHQLLKERREKEKLRLNLAGHEISPKKKGSRSYHPLSPREKIIIRRERSPIFHETISGRDSSDIRHRLDGIRSERDKMLARQNLREDSKIRCDRQREKEKIVREHIRREHEKSHDIREQRMLQRKPERELSLAARGKEAIRDRSIESGIQVMRPSLNHLITKQQLDYDRKVNSYERNYGDGLSEIDQEYLITKTKDNSSISSRFKDQRIARTERDPFHDDRFEKANYAQPATSHCRDFNDEDDILSRRDKDNKEYSHERRETNSEVLERHNRTEKHLYDKKKRESFDESNWKYAQQTGRPESRKKHLNQFSEEGWETEGTYRSVSKKIINDWNDSSQTHFLPHSRRLKLDHGIQVKVLDVKNTPENQTQISHNVPYGSHNLHSDSHHRPIIHQSHRGRGRWPMQEWRARFPTGHDLVQVHSNNPLGPRVPGMRASINRHPMGHMNLNNPERPHFSVRHASSHAQTQKHIGPPYMPRPHFPPKRQMVYTNPNYVNISRPTMVSQNKFNVNFGLEMSSLSAPKSSGSTLDHIKDITLENNKSHQSPNTMEEIEPGEIKSNNENETIEQQDDIVFEVIGHVVEHEERDGFSEISDETVEDLMKNAKNKNLKAMKKVETARINEENISDIDIKNDQSGNEDTLDFEEISDGELEEETRKNLGDALGVDWSSLKKESEAVKNKEQNPTTQQKWLPHRVILDTGVSVKYAERKFAQNILNNIHKLINNELVSYDNTNTSAKTLMELKSMNDDEKTNKESCWNDKDNIDIENSISNKNSQEDIPIDMLSDIASVQVFHRRNSFLHNNLVFNACGINSKALSARKDLKLRRRLCGLPIKEIECNRVVSELSKALALRAFQKAIEIN